MWSSKTLPGPNDSLRVGPLFLPSRSIPALLPLGFRLSSGALGYSSGWGNGMKKEKKKKSEFIEMKRSKWSPGLAYLCDTDEQTEVARCGPFTLLDECNGYTKSKHNSALKNVIHMVAVEAGWVKYCNVFFLQVGA